MQKIIVSAGLQKSGSGYIFNLVNELLKQSKNYTDVRDVKKQYSLENILEYENCLITKPDFNDLTQLCLTEKSFTFKTHDYPEKSFFDLAEKLNCEIKYIYIYRDPRDVVLSAYDHGKRLRKNNQFHTFARYDTYDKVIEGVEKWVKSSMQYLKLPGCLAIKYEDFFSDEQRYIDIIISYLNLDVEEISTNYKFNDGVTHKNIGKINRFKTDMPETLLIKVNKKLGTYIQSLGYEL